MTKKFLIICGLCMVAINGLAAEEVKEEQQLCVQVQNTVEEEKEEVVIAYVEDLEDEYAPEDEYTLV